MCGIVGYLGSSEAYPILIEALKKLEYRGYDSAGMAVWCDGKIKVARQKGKVDDLRKLCDGGFRGTLGLAHTRWATHGTPSERNAHPHRSGDVVVVHNGIVENYVELKEDLRGKGHKFLSDTDTEVIPHLVSEHLKQGAGFVDAVRAALAEMTGSYALGIIRESDQMLIAAKKESPLVIGIGDGESFVASDVPALIGRTNRFIFLEDNDIAVMKDGEVRIIDVMGKRVDRTIHTINWTGAMAEKGGYKHFMLKEIFEQPRAISDTLIGRVKEERGEVDFEELKLPSMSKVKRIWMIACGTSHHACLIGKHMFEANLRIPVEVDIASEFRYRNPIIGKDDILLLVSQSGETADTIAVMKEAKKRGIYTLAVCNVLGSTLARDSDGVIFTHAGPEIGVASTKAFTTQISVLFLLMLHLGKKTGALDSEAVGRNISEIRKIPHKLQLLLDDAGNIEELARKYMHFKNFLYLGRGINYPVSMEGALKLKEISYIHAEAYAAGEMKHGPIALIDENMPVVFVSPGDQTYKKTCSNVEEVVSRRGNIILCTDDEKHEMTGKAATILHVPSTLYDLQPIVFIVPLQLFAYHIANLLGTDVDQPRNLAKSVTVE
ncbi:MAG: Glutamine--fructose-6-phosphate aminotransferase (isomerizing) [Syntrophorhabdaceae bacterium PtaU1.Bin034]|nr:MAG: Glutamine--fructose-6-phosphate aminotransferase (isomerizing) [Syntrophorhabdaceae bacterium PtaU1.Bin034]